MLKRLYVSHPLICVSSCMRTAGLSTTQHSTTLLVEFRWWTGFLFLKEPPLIWVTTSKSKQCNIM